MENMGKLKVSFDLIGSLGLVLTGISLLLGFFSLKDSQKWKTAEFLAAEYKSFEQNSSVQLIEAILDYNIRPMPSLNNGDSTTLVNIDSILFEALEIENRVYPKNIQKARDALDVYFDRLSLFNKYIKNDLVGFEQVSEYLTYYMEIIGDTHNQRKSMVLRKRIWDYIKYYKFNDVEELLGRFGYDINCENC